jgi:hypothetical protein
MNILFFIGNGFDINLGMETRYRDFYKYYVSQLSSSGLIQNLKDEIANNIENWSDLELAIGKHTSNLETTEEFTEVFEDIEDKLADYLREVEDKFDFNKLDSKKIYSYIAFPEKSLPTADRDKLSEFKNKWQNVQWKIYLITFNYTQSLEKLLKYNDKQIQINDFISNNHPMVLYKIEHIHGYIDDRMVMGVNDISQISNSDFHNNQEVLESLVKSDCNQAQKHKVDDWCKNQISNADLICIFGSSIGDTDNLWWELIGERLKHDCRLIIFEKGEAIPPRRPQKGRIAERNKKKYFLDRTKLTDEEKKSADNKIFIGVNTDMFNIPKL